MGRIRRILLYIGTSALAFVAVPTSATTETHRSDCREVSTLSPPQDTRHILVPVIVHFMKNKNPEYAKDPEDRFSPEEIKRVLEPHGTVNKIWRQAGIRLFLYRIERCGYSARDLGFDEAYDSDKIPAPDFDGWQDYFWRVNQAYNFGDFGLDFYMWWEIRYGSGAAGPHLKNGPTRPGAVWLGSDCWRLRTRNQCELLIAHEFGHFFGLCHLCVLDGTIAGPSRLCHTCRNTTPPSCYAREAPKHFLMRADANGDKLGPAERKCAAEKAREHVPRR